MGPGGRLVPVAEHFLREGYVWVGVSAQRAGLHSATGLRAWSPTRYGALDATAANTITDDSLSYDIFSQAVKAIRSPAGLDPLGSLAAPDYVIATGHSQSAGRLRTYANSIQPLSNILDAAVLHGGGGAMRTDLPMPIFRINSEGDIAGGIGNGARAADSPTFRNWEVAGASHGDWKLITDYGPLRKRDIRTFPGGYPGEPQTCALPSLSRVPQHMVQNALYDHTFKWVAYGIAPPSAPVISTTTPTGNTVVRDSLGLAQGGIRLSQQEAPLRINQGPNTGPGFCFLDGASAPMTDAQLAALYPTVQSYVDKVVAKTLDNAAKGYIPATSRVTRPCTPTSRHHRRLGPRVSDASGTRLKASIAKAEEYGTAGDKYTAIFFLQDVATQANTLLASDVAVRDSVLRQARAVIALLEESIDNPTSTTTTGTVGGTVPATLSLTLGAPAAFPAFVPGVANDYTATTSATVTSTAGDAALSVSDPGRLTNGAFSLAEPLRVEFGKSAWTARRATRPWASRSSSSSRRTTRYARVLQQDADLHAVHDGAVRESRSASPRLVAGRGRSALGQPGGREPLRRNRQPRLGDELVERVRRDHIKPDEHRRIAIEVRRREVHVRLGLEQCVLRADVLDPHAQDVPVRRLGTECRDIGLAQRALPHEPLLAHTPPAQARDSPSIVSGIASAARRTSSQPAMTPNATPDTDLAETNTRREGVCPLSCA